MSRLGWIINRHVIIRVVRSVFSLSRQVQLFSLWALVLFPLWVLLTIQGFFYWLGYHMTFFSLKTVWLLKLFNGLGTHLTFLSLKSIWLFEFSIESFSPLLFNLVPFQSQQFFFLPHLSRKLFKHIKLTFGFRAHLLLTQMFKIASDQCAFRTILA